MTEWKKARQKPVIVEFREPDVKNSEGVLKGVAEKIDMGTGTGYAEKGKDFVIRGTKGELYPIKKAIFYETHEVVEK